MIMVRGPVRGNTKAVLLFANCGQFNLFTGGGNGKLKILASHHLGLPGAIFPV